MMKQFAMFAVLCAAAGSAFGGIIETVNSGGTPGLGASYAFSAADVGWYFTPGQSYTLTGVNFHFGTTDGRTVTEKIFTNSPSLGGSLLATATFVPGSNGFYGGTFSGISFVSGTTYFIGALNLFGLDGMVSTTSGATNLPIAFDSGSGLFDVPCNCPSSGNVMMQLVSGTTTTTPEPSSISLLLAGCGALLARRRYARRTE